VTLAPVDDAEALGAEWRGLESDADCAFFTSWSWIGPWLTMALNQGVELYLYRRIAQGQLVALALFSRTHIKRRVLFSYDTLALNEVPARGLDMIIEYNGVLIRRGHEATTYQHLARDLLSVPIHWEEIRLSGIPEAHWHQITANLPRSLTADLNERRTSWVTDIRGIEGNLDRLLTRLSRNRRWQIRRSFKAFQETDGDLQSILPASQDEALAWFDQMGALHTARWNRVGKAGSFANHHWVEFHRQVIREGFSRDEIQLVRVSAGKKTIGFIYSFIWRGTVYMLQSGFSQEEDNNKRPGFVSHCLAMTLNSTLGNHTYDFMCGDSDYKRTLAQEGTALVWGILQRKSIKHSLERRATIMARKLRRGKSSDTVTNNTPDKRL
jgi:CelD/BcsL family acetyltransferase involved in cellulose biosynthesis